MGKLFASVVVRTSVPSVPRRPVKVAPGKPAGIPAPGDRVADSKAQTRAAKRVFDKIVPRDVYDNPPDWGL